MVVVSTAAALLLAGCRGGDAPPAPRGDDPVGSVEATISSVASGFADDTTTGT